MRSDDDRPEGQAKALVLRPLRDFRLLVPSNPAPDLSAFRGRDCPERDGFIAKLKPAPRTREDMLVEIAERVAEMESFDETPARRTS